MKYAQPDLQKEIRLKIASVTGAMDVELEGEVNRFVSWWDAMRVLARRNEYCKPVSTFELSLSPRPDAVLHQ